jgi:ATP phosphoribosyltransferase
MIMTTENLVIAIPSKGRLQENANNFFGKAGLKVKQSGGGREYVGTLKGVPNVDIAFQSASEIAGNLDQGLIHFGITGEDLIREKSRSQCGPVVAVGLWPCRCHCGGSPKLD